MKIRAVFFDIDGTLLDFETHKISQSTKEAIQKLQKKWIKVAIATNRSFDYASTLEEIFEIDWDGYVACSGGEIRNKDKEIIYEKRFLPETICKIYRLAKENNIPLYSYFNKRKALTFQNQETDDFCKRFGLGHVDTVPDWDGDNIDMFCAISWDKPLLRKLFESDPNIRCVENELDNFDMFPSDISKSKGIEKMMEDWNYEPESFAAFGDSVSDIDMLEKAELGFAMPWTCNSYKENHN